MKRAILKVSARYLVSLGQGSYKVSAREIPHDVKIVGTFVDASFADALVCVVLEHDSFVDVEDGQQLPVLLGPEIMRAGGTA